MRLIDADKLIKAIEDFFENICVYDVESFEAEHDFESIVDEMETVNEWIPCSERLPDEDVEVLVYLYRDVPVIAWVDSKGRWCTEDYLVDEDDKPTAWMPLPEPYRGD